MWIVPSGSPSGPQFLEMRWLSIVPKARSMFSIGMLRVDRDRLR